MNPPDEKGKLIAQNKALREALEDIIRGCAHPDVAIRRVMLDLKPIRKVLAENPPLTNNN